MKKLEKTLETLSKQDLEIRKQILGWCAYLGGTGTKADIVKIIKKKGFKQAIIRSNAALLVLNELLIETTNYWLVPKCYELEALGYVTQDVIECLNSEAK